MISTDQTHRNLIFNISNEKGDESDRSIDLDEKYENITNDLGRPNESQKDKFKAFIWMLWDGLGFFGFDDTKLARLNGAKTSFMDKFKNRNWLMSSLIGASIISYVILSSVSKLGTIKMQKIELTE